MRRAASRIAVSIGIATCATFCVGGSPAQGQPPLKLRRPADGRGAAAGATRSLKVVQFGAPPTDADLRALEAENVRVVQYVPENAYLVWAPARAADILGRSLARTAPAGVAYAGDFLPLDAIAPALDSAIATDEKRAITVQFYAGAETMKRDLHAALRFAHRIQSPARRAVHNRYVNLRIEARGKAIESIARLASVVNVEPYVVPRLFGERQGRIMANALNAIGKSPSGPGYLAWLLMRGFSPSAGDYPVTVVVDDGVDNGTTEPSNSEFREGSDPLGASRLAFAVLPPGSAASSAEGPDGHGNINASIAGGFNNSTGAGFFEDGSGFQYGLGIAPFGRLANVRIFTPDFDPGLGDTAMVDDYFARGARISSNSWGADVYGAYDAFAQEYDALTRDARPAVPGNQELLFVFAAGNSGPYAGTVGTPGTAKNVVTVGASETSDPAASAADGCNLGSSDGDDVRDMAFFSSRGPCTDGRIKPDIVAPGTFIHGAASQPYFNGAGVCGASENDFTPPGSDALFPPGTPYTWSSGTSHSTPAIAGYASLIQENLARVHGRSNPSPALQKAYIIHSGTYLTGAGENLPGNNQGFGRVNMDLAFDPTVPRTLVDQELQFTDPGQVASFQGEVTNPWVPVRISLVWTDAPGAPFAAAPVNDLDLVVEINGDTYHGNHLAGDVSQTGGAADTLNNAESVFLPVGSYGPISIRVEASNVGGDGVPNNLDGSDQDFALVAYNVASSSSTLMFDRPAYGCSSLAGVRLIDHGMAGAGTLPITAVTDAGDDETLTATEVPPGSGFFTVDVPTVPGAPVLASGSLEVGHGQTVTVTYEDADDGNGMPATVTRTADIDCVPPSLNLTGVSGIEFRRATVSATTNEPTRMSIRLGLSCTSLSPATHTSLASSHASIVTGLSPFVPYFFAVDAADVAGNAITDDNGGTCYSFVTEPVRSFTVNSTVDSGDAVPGDGQCASSEGFCTLRAAVQEANAEAGVDRIVVPRGRFLIEIDGVTEDGAASGDLDLTRDVIIEGAGSGHTILDGGGRDRLLEIIGAMVFVSDLTVTRGKSPYYEYGGGIENLVDGDLTLTRVRLLSNEGTGGGIDNDGVLTLADCTLLRNRDDTSGGGLANYGTATLGDVVFDGNRSEGDGGGFANYGVMTVDGALVRRNEALGDGGGGAYNGGLLTMWRSTVERNRASLSPGFGGGVFNTLVADLRESTVANNRAYADGGGIENFGTLTLTNSTVTANRADYGAGGLDHWGGVSQLTNVTLTRNRAREANQIFAAGFAGELRVVNSLISGAGKDCIGPVISLGHNLDDDGTCGFVASGDRSGVRPQVNVLANNGGPTRTCSLRADSPAIDGGDASFCPPTDQRGLPRPQGATCDIGAYEAR